MDHGQPEGEEGNPQPKDRGLHQIEEDQERDLSGGGLPSAGGQMMGPSTKAEIATRTVTNNTLTQVIRTEISSIALADIRVLPSSERSPPTVAPFSGVAYSRNL